MKYGLSGGFIKFAFEKTAFNFIQKEIPEIGFVQSPDAK